MNVSLWARNLTFSQSVIIAALYAALTIYCLTRIERILKPAATEDWAVPADTNPADVPLLSRAEYDASINSSTPEER